jgi:RNA-binding protein 5/10
VSGGSVGARIMKGMGWQEGQGLGKACDGITEPLRPTTTTERAGVGSRKIFETDPTEDYAKATRRLARQRFEQMK